ncbi:efflux transporter outer membrane subunit [Cupriavidus sp. NPDC089707]|uniref:efflux transporter outer membrane subunit n=1 Tax=Cupriavidus sp. NPDC089707 TaxID=3363963 RepID=UPI0037F7DE69
MRAPAAVVILVAVAIWAMLASGCALGPDYTRPETPVPPAWRIEYPQAADVANTRWWEQFDDPVLNTLIDTSLRENRDLEIAAARVDQFAGQLSVVRSQFFPQVGYGVEASRNRASRVGQPSLSGGSPYYSLYEATLNAQWQLDLFGRVRRESESARAQLFASEYGRRGVILTIVTSVATSYVGLRSLDRQLEIARATADNYAGTLRIFDLRFKGGVVSEVEVSQVRSQYQQALAAIPTLEQQIAAQENLISILLGRNPGTIPRGKSIGELVMPAVPGDLPSALLERRPDILQAEQTLVAANADVGAARALYFPTLSLTGLLGSVSTAFGDFLTGPSAAWTVAAGLSGPLLTFGQIEGQVQSAEAAKRGAVANYQQVVLGAFRETNDALTGAVKKREENAAQTMRVAALRDYARLSRRKFDNGYASYLEVLYADNELFAAELNAVRTQADAHQQLIGVYKAVGGGWVDEAATLAPAPALMAPPADAARVSF